MSAVALKERLLEQDFGVLRREAPVRHLSEGTRQLAALALSGAHGRTMEYANFEIDPRFYLSQPTPNQICAEAVRLIGAKAPLRILPGEMVIGSASLKAGMEHRVPLTNFSSVSHTTIGFEKALRLGYSGLRREVEERLALGVDAEGHDLLEAMLVCIDAAREWNRRHVELLAKLAGESLGDVKSNYEEALATLRNVPKNPPRDFREALQALWSFWCFQRLCGNWSGIGRFDKMLGPFLEKDLAAGRLTLGDARELIAHFWIKGCEWVRGDDAYQHSVFPAGSGDAQFYQNIILSGVDESGRDITNEVTYLVLDVIEEFHISDFPTSVRVSRRTPERLWRRIAEVQRLGGGIVSIYNEDKVIAALTRFGYPLEDARNFTNDGCWETIIPGKTCFSYRWVDALLALQETLGTGEKSKAVATFDDFESLFAAFEKNLARHVSAVVNSRFPTWNPAPLLSLLVDGCVENARGYYDLGPRYTVYAPHGAGLQDAANSLLVIRKLVFEEKQVAFKDLMEAVRNDWAGREELRRRIQTRFDFYGNDSDEADAMVRRVFNAFVGLVEHARERHGVLRPAGISTFGREMSELRKHRGATAAGHRKGEILGGHFSPAHGTDKRGPTAVIRSHCAVDTERLPSCTALDLKLMPSSVKGEEGLGGLVGMLKGFVELGGLYMQVDVVDTAMLKDAQEHPAKYPNLSVRVAGWSARFASLDKNWQDLVIIRTQQEFR